MFTILFATLLEAPIMNRVSEEALMHRNRLKARQMELKLNWKSEHQKEDGGRNEKFYKLKTIVELKLCPVTSFGSTDSRQSAFGK